MDNATMLFLTGIIIVYMVLMLVVFEFEVRHLHREHQKETGRMAQLIMILTSENQRHTNS